MSGSAGSKEKILHSARELFYFVGYQATSVDDILRQCGVAKSNFYYHFKTKDELAFAVLEMYVAEFEALVRQSLYDREYSPAERLERFCRDLIDVQAEIHKMGGCPFGNFAAALSMQPGDERTQRFRSILSELFRRIQTDLSVCLEEGIARGEFRPDIPAPRLAMLLLGTIEGLMILTKTHQDTGLLRQGLEDIQRLLRVR